MIVAHFASIKEFQAMPTDVLLTFTTLHVKTSSIFLDRDSTVWYWTPLDIFSFNPFLKCQVVKVLAGSLQEEKSGTGIKTQTHTRNANTVAHTAVGTKCLGFACFVLSNFTDLN